MRLRFTIRDLLWLTALVAMGLGWWSDRSHLQSRLTLAEDSNYLANEYRLSTLPALDPVFTQQPEQPATP
jgi:hypothetical protein